MSTPGAVLALDAKVAQATGLSATIHRWTVRCPDSLLVLRDHSPHDLIIVAQFLRSRKFARALDLGCGGGRLSPLLTACATQTVLLDNNPTVLESACELAGDTASAVCARFEALPFASATFDLVASRLALHESSSHDSALGEIRRILRRKGTLLVVDVVPPIRSESAQIFDALENALNPAYVRPPGQRKWKSLLRKHGFEIERSATVRVRRELADRPFGEEQRELCNKLIQLFPDRARATLGVCQIGDRLEWADRRLVVIARSTR